MYYIVQYIYSVRCLHFSVRVIIIIKNYTIFLHDILCKNDLLLLQYILYILKSTGLSININILFTLLIVRCTIL